LLTRGWSRFSSSFPCVGKGWFDLNGARVKASRGRYGTRDRTAEKGGGLVLQKIVLKGWPAASFKRSVTVETNVVNIERARARLQTIRRFADWATIEFATTGQLGLLADPEMKARLVETIADDLLSEFPDLFAD
jgi:hypothetical protein